MGGKRRARKQQNAARSLTERKARESRAALTAGQAKGREAFTELTGGLDKAGVGDMMQTGIQQQKDQLDRYSGASAELRQRGNQAAMQARVRGGNLGGQTGMEQAQIATGASQTASNQRYKEQMAAESNYQRMSANLMSNAATLEQGYGAQQMASVAQLSQMDAPQQKGLFK